VYKSGPAPCPGAGLFISTPENLKVAVMIKFWKMRKVGRVVGAIGLVCLLAWLLIQPAAHRDASFVDDPKGLVLSQALPEASGPDPSAMVGVRESPAPKALESTEEQERSKTPKLQKPKIARFALPAGLNSAALGAIVKKCAQEQGVDEDLVWAVIRQESGGDPRAMSPKGAMGLMQLMPGTAAYLGVTKPFDPEQNISGGIQYLLECLNRFQQDVRLALAAYNAGPGNVIKYNGCPPFAETRNYVAAVMQVYQRQWRPPGLEDEGSASFRRAIGISGLSWRIPLPRWKIIEPEAKISPPQWKARPRTS
jgi:hypothetical protein